MQQIERGIIYEDSYLGVTVGGIISSQGTIMIDAPLRPEDARSWRSTLSNQRGGSNRLLVNLDAHPDRTLGARALDCTVVAQQKTAQVFRNRPSIFKAQNALSGAAWEVYNEAVGMRWTPPDITFTQRMSLHWGAPEVILEHHPGPTSGTSWAILPTSKVIFVGDTLVLEQPPFLASADLGGWLESLELLKSSYGDYIIIAGRGGMASDKSISRQIQQLMNIIKEIERLVKRSAAPEATEGLISSLLSEYTFDEQWKDLYTQRLRHGLYQYYARHYRPASSLEQTGMEEDEQTS
jgi:cyclase